MSNYFSFYSLAIDSTRLDLKANKSLKNYMQISFFAYHNVARNMSWPLTAVQHVCLVFGVRESERMRRVFAIMSSEFHGEVFFSLLK